MATTRKQQAELERLRKKVLEGVDVFEVMWVRAQLVENRAQRKRSCAELKKEVKKLRRLREQVRALLASSELRDKGSLEELRKLTETQMERFERFERQTLAKAFSTATLSRAGCGQTHGCARAELTRWLEGCVVTLQTQLTRYEHDAEVLSCARRPWSRDACARLSTLAQRRTQHAFHIERLAQLAASCADSAQRVDVTRIQRIREDVDHYVTSSAEPDFQDNEFLYDDLGDDLGGDLDEDPRADSGDMTGGNEHAAADDSRAELEHAQDGFVGQGDYNADTRLRSSAAEHSRTQPSAAEQTRQNPSADKRLESRPKSAELQEARDELQVGLRPTCSCHGPSESGQASRSKSRSGTLSRHTKIAELCPESPDNTRKSTPERPKSPELKQRKTPELSLSPELTRRGLPKRTKSPEYARRRTPERWDEDSELKPNSPRPHGTKIAECKTKMHDAKIEDTGAGTQLSGAWKLRAEERRSELGKRPRGIKETDGNTTTGNQGQDHKGTGNQDPGVNKEGQHDTTAADDVKGGATVSSWSHAQRSEVFLSWLFQDYLAFAHNEGNHDSSGSWFSRLPPVDITFFTRSPSATEPVAAWHACAASQPISAKEQWRGQRLADSYCRLQRTTRREAEPGDAQAWSAARDCMH